MPLGVVVRRTPGATRWAKFAWTVSSVLPGAAAADWKVMRSEGGVTEFHAATLPLTLYVSDAEAYAHELQARTPSIYVVLRQDEQAGAHTALMINGSRRVIFIIAVSPTFSDENCPFSQSRSSSQTRAQWAHDPGFRP
ncbi:DUF3305 domain-containing protein [Ascidiaceihabitans sp.]|nr:DUF3305 domain-containing protein [Ascidiaceihabitans sp.]